MFIKKAGFKFIVMIILVFVCLVGCTGNAVMFSEPDETTPQKENKSATEKSSILIVTGEYIPYTSQTLLGNGFFTQIVEKICENANIDAEIKFYPWARCEEMVLSGEAWAAFPYSHSEERDSAYLFTNSILDNKHLFFYLAGNEKITDEVMGYSEIGDFTDFTFGGANGYWYGTQKDFTALGVRAEWANDTDALLKMLYAKRVDFIIEDERVASWAINKLFPEEKELFKALPKDAKVQNYHLIVSKVYPNSEKIVNQFNESLQEIKATGEIEQIMKNNEIA